MAKACQNVQILDILILLAIVCGQTGTMAKCSVNPVCMYLFTGRQYNAK